MRPAGAATDAASATESAGQHVPFDFGSTCGPEVPLRDTLRRKAQEYLRHVERLVVPTVPVLSPQALELLEEVLPPAAAGDWFCPPVSGVVGLAEGTGSALLSVPLLPRPGACTAVGLMHDLGLPPLRDCSIPGRMAGVLRSVGTGIGDAGCIDCPHTFALFEQDILLESGAFEGLVVGDHVAFNVSVDAEGRPIAQNLEVLRYGRSSTCNEGGVVAAPTPGTNQFQPPPCLAAKQWPHAFSGAHGACAAAAPGLLPSSFAGYLGVSLSQGSVHFPGQYGVADLQGTPPSDSQPFQVAPLRHPPSGSLASGDSDPDYEAHFRAYIESPEGQLNYARYAAALQLQFQAATTQCHDAYLVSDEKDKEKTGSHRTPSGAFLSHDPSRVFCGVIAKWLDDDGFGFIRCKESQKVYGKDVFLHKAQVGQESDLYKQRTRTRISNGQRIKFSVEICRGMPRAKEIEFEMGEDGEAEERPECSEGQSFKRRRSARG